VQVEQLIQVFVLVVAQQLAVVAQQLAVVAQQLVVVVQQLVVVAAAILVLFDDDEFVLLSDEVRFVQFGLAMLVPVLVEAGRLVAVEVLRVSAGKHLLMLLYMHVYIGKKTRQVDFFFFFFWTIDKRGICERVSESSRSDGPVSCFVLP
jgi:hypothetical protein